MWWNVVHGMKWLVMVLAMGAAIYLVGVGSLGYRGYCFDEERFLTDDEKILKVVQRTIVGRNPPLPFWLRRDKDGQVMKDGNGNTSWVIEGQDEPVQPVAYRDTAEFFADNPDCCVVRRYYSDAEGRWEPGFWERVIGNGGGVVWASYYYRYRDRHGYKHTATYTYLEPLTNCGKELRLF